MTIEELSTAWVVFAGILGAVFLIDKTLDLIKKYKAPADDLKTIVARHTELLSKDNERIHNLENTMQETTRVQNKALLQLMNHSLDGNHIDKLKEARDQMEDFLINH